MSYRRYMVLFLFAAACGKAPQAGEQHAATAPTAKDDRVLCALDGAARFAPDCRLEEKGASLTILAPDGSFRRLQVAHDGRGVVTADGAEPARVTIIGQQQIEVAIGGDRYRLPATVK